MTGYLRKFGDSYYIIPENKLKEFDESANVMWDKGWNQWTWKLWEEFSRFDEYRHGSNLKTIRAICPSVK